MVCLKNALKYKQAMKLQGEENFNFNLKVFPLTLVLQMSLTNKIMKLNFYFPFQNFGNTANTLFKINGQKNVNTMW